MKKYIICQVISFIFISAGIIIISYRVSKIEEECKSLIGKEIILKKDTVIITDYSLIFDEYRLSNGAKISTEFANKKLIK